MSQQLCVSIDRSTKNRLDAAGPSRSAAARCAIHAGLPLAEAMGGPKTKLVLRGRWRPGDGDWEWPLILVDIPAALAKVLVAMRSDLKEVLHRHDSGSHPSSVKVWLLAGLLDGGHQHAGLPANAVDAVVVLCRAVSELERAVYDATSHPSHIPGLRNRGGVSAYELWSGLQTISIDGEPIAETHKT